MSRHYSSRYESSRNVPIYRDVPIRYETDLWRPVRWESSFREPSFREPLWPAYTYSPPSPPPPAIAPSPEFSSSLVHYPSREQQASSFENEMRRMNEEMSKMMGNMQRLAPAPAPTSSVDDWRLTENFRMENPIITERDGSRKFKLQFDVRQFKPEEIQVKTAGNTLSVHAKHEDKDQGKSVFREYNRQYVVPKDVHPDQLSSKLGIDGILTIEAPLPAIEGRGEKMIPIKHN